jgi:hypothetical protein
MKRSLFAKVQAYVALIVLLQVPLAMVSAETNGGPILRQDFSVVDAWSQMSATVLQHGSSTRVLAEKGPFGTIDISNSTTPSDAVRLTVSDTDASNRPWSASISSGLLAVKTSETDLRKLTVSFDNSISSTRPVIVQIESYDSNRHRTGGREAVVYPAAPDFFIRSAIELSDMKTFGTGKFRPTDPFVQFSFVISRLPGRAEAKQVQLSIDNVTYASPAYYVSPNGSDANDGRSEATAFATPQKALNVANSGDIILLMEGTYDGGASPVASFTRAGAPDGWITLKNYPGQHPLLTGNGWNIISISEGKSGEYSNVPSLAYLEVRGLHIRGIGDVVKEKYPDSLNRSDPRSNSNGIAIDGRYMTHVPHHIRVADNLVEYCPAAGIGALEADWITIEHNICRNNCWTTIYATSGISTLGASNFDGTYNRYRNLIRNNICDRNQTYYKWKDQNKMSDGNGIIIDLNQHTPDRPNSTFTGRTLVQNNLSFCNGGSGIHTVDAYHVDIINNTAYMNSASPTLQYSEIFTYGSDDVRILNNILVAPVADLTAGQLAIPVNLIGGPNGKVTFANNVYFGGNIPPEMGSGDKFANPQFVNPSADPTATDFRLKPTSPAIRAGQFNTFSPYVDFDGRPRGVTPDAGAFQESPANYFQSTNYKQSE